MKKYEKQGKTQFSTSILAASDLFNVFTQSIKV